MTKGRKVSTEEQFKLLNVIKDAGTEGIVFKQIEARTGIPYGTLHARIKRLVVDGFIYFIPESHPKLYYISTTGQQMWKNLQMSGIVVSNEYPTSKPDTRMPAGGPRYNLEGLVALQRFRVKFPILKLPDLYWGKLFDDMKNWLQGRSEWKNCVEFLQGAQTDDGTVDGKLTKATSIEIRVKMLIGENEHQLENLAWEICREHARMMEELGGYTLGNPKQIGEAEFELASALAQEEIDMFGWAKGVRDKSVFQGEFVCKTPDEVKSIRDLAHIPGMVAQNQRTSQGILDELKDINRAMSDFLGQVQFNGKMLHEVAKANVNIQKLLGKVTGITDNDTDNGDDKDDDAGSDAPAEMFG